MSKGKRAKFADMAQNPLVIEQPYNTLQEESNFPLKGHWHSDFFHNTNPIVLELGCGRGEYTIGLARRYPDKNFIGVDIKGARMWTGAQEALNTGMPNAGLLRPHIEFIDRFFAPSEVSEVWLTFSDPQMKKATTRLTSTYSLERYRRFLEDGGLIHLKTDSNFLFTYTCCMVQANRLPVVFSTDNLYHTLEATTDNEVRQILGIQTYYEQQWIARGLTIKYLKFCLPAQGQLTEPEVDIELDDYRSYNRSKRSGLTTSR